MDVATKKCYKCGHPKSLNDFHALANSLDGRGRVCKSCDSGRRGRRYSSDPERAKADSQSWRDANRAQVREKNLDYKRRLRLEAIAYYSNGKNVCACCDESEMKFLTIDHVNGGGKEHRRQMGPGTPIALWLKKNGYPPGFEILCFNCNCAKGAYGICPHNCRTR